MTMSLEPAATQVSRRTRRLPAWIALIADATAWFVSLLVLTFSRYLLAGDGLVSDWSSVLSSVALVSLMCIVLFAAGSLMSGLYRHRYIVGSLDEARMLAVVAFAVWVVFAIVDLATVAIPRSVVLPVFPTVLLLMGAVRLAYRHFMERRVGPAGSATPVLFLRASELGHSVVHQMMVDPLSEFRPVGFIDDGPGKKNFAVGGIKVLGASKSGGRRGNSEKSRKLIRLGTQGPEDTPQLRTDCTETARFGVSKERSGVRRPGEIARGRDAD